MHAFLFLVFLSHLLTKPSISLSVDEKVTVQTKLGLVSGTLIQRSAHAVSVFKGIPFAEPAIDDLRFRKPVAKVAWHPNVLHAIQQRPACAQSRLLGHQPGIKNTSEDCLYLNIFVPRNLNNRSNSDKLMPVMVWIHDGAFIVGSNYRDGSQMAVTGDVVVVTISYRLSILGFLQTTDPENAAPNAGLLDQVMALRFVHENIHSFNGDKESITLFGESAGGISISWHMMSNLSRGFFKRAIMQSGAPLTLMLMGSESGPFSSEEAAILLNCPYIHKNVSKSIYPVFTNETFKCLRSVSAEKLSEVADNVTKAGKAIGGFNPNVDKEFFSGVHPLEFLRSGNETYSPYDANHREILIGTNAAEGAGFFASILPTLFPSNKQTPANLSWHDVERVMIKKKPEKKKEIMQMLDMMIGGDRHNQNKSQIFEKLNRLFTDLGFLCPTLMLISSFVAGGDRNAFHYVFEHKKNKRTSIPWSDAATHTEEIDFVFGYPFIHPEDFTDGERDLSLRIMKKWTRFARHGHPTEGKDDWPPSYDSKDGVQVRKYLVFGKNLTERIMDEVPANDCPNVEPMFDSVKESTRFQDM